MVRSVPKVQTMRYSEDARNPMKNDLIQKLSGGLWCLVILFAQAGLAEDLSFRLVEAKDSRVNVFVGDELFTSYIYGLGFHKPIFYPLKSPAGNAVTRSYPIEFGVSGEEPDHWHHESLWLTYGDVNGIDFWAKKETRRESPGSGKIVHTGISQLESGKKGYLEATADWVQPDGKTILKQKSQVRFQAASDWRLVDLTITLTAQDEKVTFGDTKEGMFGIRVTPSLRENHTGAYLNASGAQGEKGVWGKRSPWCALTGRVKDEDLTLAIFNHPVSTGYPTFWHARSYGLFAANPFGKKDFEAGSSPLNVMIHPGEQAVFRYRVLIESGKLGLQELERRFKDFARAQD